MNEIIKYGIGYFIIAVLALLLILPVLKAANAQDKLERRLLKDKGFYDGNS